MSDTNTTKYHRFVHYAFLISLAAIGFFLPFRVHYAHIAISCALFFWLLNVRDYWRLNFATVKTPLFIFISLYAIQVVGLVHTSNLGNGLFVLEKKLPLLLMPLMILVSSLNNSEIRRITFVFIAGVILSALYYYVIGIGKIINEGLPLTAFFTDERFQNQNFTGVIDGMHPAYFTVFLSLCIFVLMLEFPKVERRYWFVYGIIIIFLLLTAVVAMSRGGLLGMFAAMTVFLGYRAIVGNRFGLLLSGAALGVLLIVLTFRLVPNLKVRLMESFDGMTSGLDDNEAASPQIHAKSWYCALSSGMDEHFVFGHGTGDEEDVLRSCYAGNGWMSMAAIGYDSHNEYLSQFVKQGFFGLLILLVCFGYATIIAIRHNSVSYLLFLVVVVIAAFSESILRGSTSLVFYAFFNVLYFRQLLNDKNGTSIPVNPNL